MSQGPIARKTVKRTVEVETVHDRTIQEVIYITSDKLEIELGKHLHKVAEANKWQNPLSLFVGVIIVFCTSSFKDFFGVPAAVWHAIFLIGGFVFLVMLAKAVWAACRAPTLEELIRIIKNAGE